MSDFKIVAHRGASGHAPENTFAAFVKAVEMGANAIEIDVHQTSDGKTIIIHDDTLERTTTGRGPVCSKTYNELKLLDAGSWFGTGFADERIPLLSDFLDWAKNKVTIIVEVKFGSEIYPNIEKNVWKLLKDHSITGTTILSSSKVTVLNNFKTLSPDVQLGKILTPRELWRSLFQPDSLLYKQNLMSQIGEIHPHWSFVDGRFMDWAKHSGKSVIPWTVNNLRKIRVMRDRGVQGVISNFPDIVQKAMRS